MSSSRILSLLICIFIGTFSTSGAPNQPNILFIITDDHAVNALGTEGNSLIPLPQLNKLGKEGMVFDKSFCCNSICGPSRAAILTGRHSHKNGFISNEWCRFDGTQPNYAKLLQKNNYQTGYIGKWHLASNPTGFDFWEVVPNQGSYYNPDFIKMDNKKHRRAGYATDIITDMSLEWLENRDKSKPFMLVVGHKAPHRAWSPSLRHLGKADVSKLPIPKTLYDDYANRPNAVKENQQTIAKHLTWGSDLKILSDKIPDDSPAKKFVHGTHGELNRMTPEEKATFTEYYTKRTQDLVKGLKPGGKLHDEKAMIEWKWRAYMEDYLSCLLAVDESVGKLTDYIDKNGLAKDTLIVYCGDQSFYLGEHGMYDKRWVFEESLKMPLIMRWKGKIAPNTRSQALVQNIDYAPTFAQIAGADTQNMGFQGISLTPIMFGKGKTPKNWRKSLYYAFYEWPAEHNCARHDAIRTERYTLAHLPASKEWMLFDLDKDPDQMKNFAQDPQYSTILENLKKQYYATRKAYEVPDNLPGDTKEHPQITPSW